MFHPQHLEGASSDLVWSMFQVGRKAAELERVKLRVEIQKEKSEIRQKNLEKQLKMAGKAGGQSGLAKNPKKTKTKEEQDNDNSLDDLVVERDPDKRQTSYSTLEPGGFVTKGADRNTQLDQRQARILAAAGEPDEDGDKEETEQERLEREANELSSQLKKAEKAGENYSKVIQSMFWAVKANKQTILNGADPDEVSASIPDLKCRAWWMKLNGKTAVDPGTLTDDKEIGPQTASEMMKMKLQEVFELVEEELVGKNREQVNAIKKCIGNVCREQALAHRHAAEAADNLAMLMEMVSLPILVKVISGAMRPTVAIKIPKVDDMIVRAQEKVDVIKQAKHKVGELRPIDEVIFAQNVPKYNPEWEHLPNGRATSYLATLVCCYMHKLQQKDKKVVLSAKGLETIYHKASSSIGKLVSGKQYLGGYALEQVRDKVEAEGKELPFRKKKKLPQRSSGFARTSSGAMEH